MTFIIHCKFIFNLFCWFKGRVYRLIRPVYKIPFVIKLVFTIPLFYLYFLLRRTVSLYTQTLLRNVGTDHMCL